ncbi:hypothetical protein BDZ45DRAFT_735781 [Acephala macrosclerotiorum]|nr:hypothetical protein BDZ45DRAFT_735781 [Acephala macrosclerotiorum]
MRRPGRAGLSAAGLSSRACLCRVIRKHRRCVSTKAPTAWSEDQFARIYIQSISNSARLIAAGLERMEKPPPISFLVHNNPRFQQFEDSNAKIEVIEGSSHHVTKPFHVNVMPIQEEPLIERRATAIHYRYKTLIKRPNQSGLHVMQNSTAMAFQEPIRNYILPQASHHIVPTLQQLKDHLRHDSTIVFLQKNLGLIEIVNREVFPDPKTRPNYMSGRLSHQVWSQEQPQFDECIRTFKGRDLLRALVRVGVDHRCEHLNKSPFLLKHTLPGNLFLGPVCLDTDHEDFEDLRIRQKSANYLTNALLGATNLGTQAVRQEEDLDRRLTYHGIQAALFGVTIVYNCCTRDVLMRKESKARVQALLKEIWAVMQYDASNLKYQKFAQYIERYVAHSAGIPLNSMFKSLILGMETDIEFVNGWIVERGKKLIPPISCPENERLIAEVKVIEKEVQDYIAEVENEIRAEKAEQRRKQRRAMEENKAPDFAAENERARLRKEARDMKEIVEGWGAKKSKVGRKPPPMPSHYQQPSIMGFGNSELTRTNHIVRRVTGTTDQDSEPPLKPSLEMDTAVESTQKTGPRVTHDYAKPTITKAKRDHEPVSLDFVRMEAAARGVTEKIDIMGDIPPNLTELQRNTWTLAQRLLRNSKSNLVVSKSPLHFEMAAEDLEMFRNLNSREKKPWRSALALLGRAKSYGIITPSESPSLLDKTEAELGQLNADTTNPVVTETTTMEAESGVINAHTTAPALTETTAVEAESGLTDCPIPVVTKTAIQEQGLDLMNANPTTLVVTESTIQGAESETKDTSQSQL